MATGQNSSMIIDSLRLCTLDFILNSENPKEAFGSLWSRKEFIPSLIHEKRKHVTKPVDRLLYSFNPYILEHVWGCPKEYLNEYSDSSDITDLLDDIIWTDGFDIMKTPYPILELVDKRDKQICETPSYKFRFVEFTEFVPEKRNKEYMHRIVEDKYGVLHKQVRKHPRPHRPNPVEYPFAIENECYCLSEYYDDECHCPEPGCICLSEGFYKMMCNCGYTCAECGDTYYGLYCDYC